MRFLVWLTWLLRVALGGLFLVSGALKLRDPAAFAVEVANYQWWPQIAPLLAIGLPPLEVVVGGALLLPSRRWARAGSLLAIGMFATFTVAVASVVVRGVNISCGCFGHDSGSITGLTVVRNLLLLAGAMFLFWVLGSPVIATEKKHRLP